MRSAVGEALGILQERSPAPLRKIRIEEAVPGFFFTGGKLSTDHGGVASAPLRETRRFL